MNEQNENGINSPTNYNVSENKKKKKTFLWLAVSIGIVALLSAMAFVFSIGPNTIGGSTDKEVNDVPGILMFASPDENPDVGNLYYQCYGKQKILIASNVSNGGYELLPKTQLVVYRDKNGKLFCKYPDQESELISANWNHYTVSENEKMIFLYEGDDLSCYTVGVGKEKITSRSEFNEESVTFDEDNVYFIKSESYYKWNLENGLEKLFPCGNHYSAKVSGEAYCYFTEDNNNGYKLYAKLKNEDYEERISTMPVYSYLEAEFAHDGYSVVYIRNENGDYEFGMSGELCLYTKGCDEIEIASDITNFKISDDDKYLYYTDEHGFLYVVELPKITKNSYKNPKRIINDYEKLEPIKLGECNGFIGITGNSEIVVFTDDTETLYVASAKTGEKSKISSDVGSLHVAIGKNMCAFVTNSGNLFINNNLNAIKNVEKNNILLVKNMEKSFGFGYSDNYYSATENAQYLFYMNETDNKLYIVSDNGKAKVFIENVAEFDYIKHNGTVLYEKQLTRADIEGYYTANNEETSLFYKFGTDGMVEICSLANDSSEERNYPEHIMGYSWEIYFSKNKTESRISYKKDVNSQYLEYLDFKVDSDGKKYLLFEDSTLDLRSVNEEEFEQIKSLTSAVTEYLDEDVEVSSDDTLYSEPNYNSTSDLKFTHSGEKTVKGYFIPEDKSTIWLKLRINVDYESSYVWFPVSVVENDNV